MANRAPRDCRSRARLLLLAATLLGSACATAGGTADTPDRGGADDAAGDSPADVAPDTADDDGGGGEGGCPPGETLCDSACTDTTSDPTNCGGCGVACAAPWDHTEPVCVDSYCVVRCQPGWVDLDGEPGCEQACPGGGPETCNGADDDCDGATDNGFPCAAGAAVACTTDCLTRGTGTCTAACAEPASADCAPPPEACNGADDDCDGTTDEELPCSPGDPMPCTTPCGSGGSGACTALCEIPAGAACTPPPEACNGADDDCDGAVDEDFSCIAGTVVGCSTSCGSAGSGRCTDRCTLPTGAACAPPVEACNGRDDDCNGATDEGLPCAPGQVLPCVTTCGTSGTGACSPLCELPSAASCTPPAESCNARDDDCDTAPDEDFPCVQGQPTSCTTSCGGTATGTCSATCGLPTGAACPPPAETCNGADDDCDGTADDGFACVRGASVPCTTPCGGTATGTCTTTCTVPTGAACPAPAETCNAADDDCDGAIDEGLAGCATCPRSCAGRDCGDDGCAGSCGSCTAPATCDAGGHCVAPACPIQGCTTGTESRDRCSGARVIGRATARTTGGYTISASTCSASNRSDTSCWDAGADHHYRIFLRTGDRIDVRIVVGWACPAYSSSWWDASFKLYGSAGCTDTTCATRLVCEEAIPDTFNYAYTADADRWYVLVVDGYTAFDDEGDYDLTVRLTCLTAGCEC
jgi:hypothetical protein